jgi:hypothetical protein
MLCLFFVSESGREIVCTSAAVELHMAMKVSGEAFFTSRTNCHCQDYVLLAMQLLSINTNSCI